MSAQQPASYPYDSVRSEDLRVGMVVLCHGMRCLIDEQIRSWESRNGGENKPVTVYGTLAKVLNREDVPRDQVPLSFTDTSSYPARGMEPSNAPHRWTIQGASWVRWTVERADQPSVSA